MKHTAYYDFNACPLTDEDLLIIRGLASRIGGAYYSIHQTEQAISDRRDYWNSKQYAKTTPDIYSLRRDSCKRLVPPARCMA